MADKYQDIYHLYEAALKEITQDASHWKAFLTTACYNFGLPFDEQVLLFAQRPDARAVLKTQDWNRRYGRWVKAGSRGIAVIDKDSSRPKLNYYFDISDTEESRYPELVQPVPLWEMTPSDESMVRAQLREAFGIAADGPFEDLLSQTAESLVSLSFGTEEEVPIEPFHSNNTVRMDKVLLVRSVTYMLEKRLGYPDTKADLMGIRAYHSQEAVNIFGAYLNNISAAILRTVAAALRYKGYSIAHPLKDVYNAGNQTKNGRSESNDVRGLSERGRVLPAKPENQRSTGSERQMGVDEGSVSEDTPLSSISQPADQREIEQLSDDRTTGSGTAPGSDNSAADAVVADQREAESKSADALGAADGTDSTMRRGGDQKRANLSVASKKADSNESEIPSIQAQMTFLEKQAEESPSSAFSFSEEQIAEVLRKGSGFGGSKQRIADSIIQFETLEEKARFLQKEYGIGGAYPAALDINAWHDAKGLRLSQGDHEQHLTWHQVARRIEALVKSDAYLSASERQRRDTPAMTHREEIEAIDEDENENYTQYIVDNIDKIIENSHYIEKQKDADFRDAMPPSAKAAQSAGSGIKPEGPKKRFEQNVTAIEILKQCEAAERLPSQEEREQLKAYVGWGGLADAFEDSRWPEESRRLKELLTEAEYRSARESTLTAFYTPPEVIEAVYQAFEHFGFQKGKVLEPSCGIGAFLEKIPKSWDLEIDAVELDDLSGRIATLLYPDAHVHIQGYETTTFEKNTFDIAVGNVPFGEFQLNDPAYAQHSFLIHDYFFARTLDLLRPGGILAFITSKGTMDKQNPAVRRYLAERAEFIGGIRLPDTTFAAAAGTRVTADILFLKKREHPYEIDAVEDAGWVDVEERDEIVYNHYFALHPEMVLGDLVVENGPYGPTLACKAREGDALSLRLENAVKHLKAVISTEERTEDTNLDEMLPADPSVRNFSFTLVKDRLYYRVDHTMTQVNDKPVNEKRIRALIALRDTLRELIDLERFGASDEAILSKQAALEQHYDAYAANYGRINSQGTARIFREDSSYPLLCSLEILDENRRFVKKSDIFFKRTILPQTVVTHAHTAQEALALSLSEKGRVDLSYMAGLLRSANGAEKGEKAMIENIIEDLKEVIYKDPLSGPFDVNLSSALEGWQTADAYLSGNVRQKLKIAESTAAEDTFFQGNVKALQAVQPEDIQAEAITVRLGSTWIPEKVVEGFVYELLETPFYARNRIRVHYFDFNAEWHIENKGRDSGNIKANSVYGTRRRNAYAILEDTLNLKETRIYDTIVDAEGKKKSVLNQQETMAAMEKQEAIKQAFADWIWKEPSRREMLTRLYNERYNAVVPRHYDGSHLHFEGMNPEMALRQHQKNAVARILYGGNTLLAHVVGSGKTFTMIAAAMEMKRIGLCHKSMVVVPNHLVDQFASEWHTLYPGANLLVTTKRDFEKHHRRQFIARIATGDYDAVIISHSQFSKIPISPERERGYLEKEVEQLTNAIAEMKSSFGERLTIKQMEKTRKKLNAKIARLSAVRHQDDTLYFEALGIDRLFVDEADLFKNLYVYSKMRNVGGIAQTESQKATDLYNKTRYLDELTGGKGVIFATGTPISNSMVELYTMQRYLQAERLKEMGLVHFDAWASTFGETVTALELAPEGTGYRMKTRFARFFNLPELMQVFREVADIQTQEMLDLPVPKAHFDVVKTKQSAIQKELLQTLVTRAEAVRNRQVRPEQDNMLTITNDGRKLALDERLLNPLLPDETESKVNACVKNVFETWKSTSERKSTQLIFSDLSTPKHDGFDVYHDIKKKLLAEGIPEEEIAFIHDYPTEIKKKELYSKVRNGVVRVLLGSTAKLGAGTNVQDKMIKLHDLDCPWRPRDVGRILRTFKIKKNVEVTDNGKIII